MGRAWPREDSQVTKERGDPGRGIDRYLGPGLRVVANLDLDSARLSCYYFPSTTSLLIFSCYYSSAST